jgi:hypothetical protein
MNKPITNLISKLKKQYPDGKHWRPDFIYQATQRRLSQDVARSLSDMIDEYIEYNSDRANYLGIYEDLFEVIGGEEVRDFIVNYSLKAGITESENEAHRFVDHLLAAEEVLEANTPLEGTLAHYEIEQGQPPQEVATGINQFGEDTVLEIEAQGNPNEETQVPQY